MFKDEHDCKSFNWLNKVDSVRKTIDRNDNWAYDSKANVVRSIYSILSRLDGYDDILPTYQKLQKEYNDNVRKQRGKNVMTAKEQRNMLPWAKIKSYRDKYWSKQEELLYALYTYIPPRRNKDYMLLRLLKSNKMTMNIAESRDKSYNYLVVDKNNNVKGIILNRYKTYKRYGPKVIDFSKLKDQAPNFQYSKLQKLATSFIKQAVKENGYKSGDYIFPSDRDKSKPMTQFTIWVKHIFKGTGKQITANILRHSFITDFLQKNPNASDNTIAKMASALGHSSQMMLSYRKIDAIDSDEDTDDGN